MTVTITIQLDTDEGATEIAPIVLPLVGDMLDDLRKDIEFLEATVDFSTGGES